MDCLAGPHSSHFVCTHRLKTIPLASWISENDTIAGCESSSPRLDDKPEILQFYGQIGNVYVISKVLEDGITVFRG